MDAPVTGMQGVLLSEHCFRKIWFAQSFPGIARLGVSQREVISQFSKGTS